MDRLEFGDPGNQCRIVGLCALCRYHARYSGIAGMQDLVRHPEHHALATERDARFDHPADYESVNPSFF